MMPVQTDYHDRMPAWASAGGQQFWEGDPIRVTLIGGEIVDGQFVSGTPSNFEGITIETWRGPRRVPIVDIHDVDKPHRAALPERDVRLIESQAKPAERDGTIIALRVEVKDEEGKSERITARLSVVEARRISRLVESALDDICNVTWPAHWS